MSKYLGHVIILDTISIIYLVGARVECPLDNFFLTNHPSDLLIAEALLTHWPLGSLYIPSPELQSELRHN